MERKSDYSHGSSKSTLDFTITLATVECQCRSRPGPTQKFVGAHDQKTWADVALARIRVARDICDAKAMGILETAGHGELEKLERSVTRMPARRLAGTQTSSGATFVALVRPADLANGDNLARREGLQRAWLRTILVMRNPWARTLLEDQPGHTRLLGLLVQAFTPRRIEEMRPHIVVSIRSSNPRAST
jgi:hypothetical protein